MALNLASLSAELDYVDQAARDVLDRNAREAHDRMANERRDELNRVLRRVDNICSNFENYEAYGNGKTSVVQFVSGLAELEKIVSDPQAKKKYLDDVTIFVVGYENKCNSRLHLIEQVSEFLLENEALFDSDLNSDEPVNFEELNASVESTITSVGELNSRLGDLHRGVVEGLAAHYNSKGAQKQKKKLEKELEALRKDFGELSDKLVHLNSELQDRDLKAQQMARQIENKNAELHKLRAAVEINKAAAAQLAELQAEHDRRGEEIEAVKTDLERLKLETGEEMHRDKMEIELLRDQTGKLQAEIDDLKTQLNDAHAQYRAAQNELEELRLNNESRLASMKAKYRRQIASAKKRHEDESAKLQEELRKAYAEMSRAESEFDENKQTIFVPDDDERPTEEDVMEFDTEIAFDDDSAWDAVPRSHRRGRFTQYRNLARAKLAQEAEQSKQRADRKILQLKSRFNEFKAQWDEERQGLELSVQEAERETEDAKRKAELAVRKLEELYERFKDTQSLSTADSSELHSRIGQLQVDKTQLETRVEELEHELRVINQLLKKAAKDKEEAEKKLAAASAHEQPASRGDGEEQFEESMTAGIQSDEEGSSVDIPFPDDAGGQPGLHLADHPIVGEFIRTYNHIMKSKTRLSELLSENDSYKEVANNLASLGQEALKLDRKSRITPQIEDLGRNLTFVSDQIFLLVENVILSIENLRRQQQQSSSEPTVAYAASPEADAATKQKEEELIKQIEELKNKYLSVGRLMQEKEAKFQSELAERDVEIRELQKSVAQLQSDLSRLRAEQQVDLQNSLMFTKLDAERNTKTLKRALASRRIGEAAYETAVEAMEEYASVPARRLLTMARRLLHRRTVEQLQRAVQQGDGFTEDRARLLLARLEDYEAGANRRYDQIMDRLREERLRLARGLVDTFDDVGESCSIFLIRPVLSLRHRDNLEQHYHSIVEQNRRAAAQRRSEDELQALGRGRLQQQRLSPCPEEEAADGSRRLPDIAGSGVRHDTSLSDVWNIHSSTDMRMLPAGFDRTLLNTPRLLEMDVNKILLGQNRISASLDAETGSGGGAGLRYYVPLKRRSLDTFSATVLDQGAPPPTTPALGKQLGGGNGGASGSATTVPLPPIKSKTHS
uniref:M protein repeat protein n=1 Tax=Macrostomum lignano TaxID=282301 RepID=A0A1I8JKQ0_9PLAT